MREFYEEFVPGFEKKGGHFINILLKFYSCPVGADYGIFREVAGQWKK